MNRMAAVLNERKQGFNDNQAPLSSTDSTSHDVLSQLTAQNVS